MRDALRRLHCWVSLTVGLGCLIVGLSTPPAVALALFLVACGLLLDGATAMWARAGGTGGLHDHRQ
jgi:hypothetical protein